MANSHSQQVADILATVLNKYFPPDFDPDLIPRRSGTRNSQQVVRLMAPFSMQVLSPTFVRLIH